MVNVPNSFAFVPDGADQGNVMAAQVAVNWIITANP
jgi:hypothetical protein